MYKHNSKLSPKNFYGLADFCTFPYQNILTKREESVRFSMSTTTSSYSMSFPPILKAKRQKSANQTRAIHAIIDPIANPAKRNIALIVTKEGIPLDYEIFEGKQV